MTDDLTTKYGFFAAGFSLLFGIEFGVVLCALAGAFLSLRYSETKGTLEQCKYVGMSLLIACIIIIATTNIHSQGKEIHVYPAWLSLKLLALLYGFLILLLAGKIHKAVKDIDLSDKFSTLWDKLVAKWIG